MEHSQDGVKVPKLIKYLPQLGPTPEPLRIVNTSNNAYVFKIRTNQRTVISLHSTHGFLKPASTLQLSVKILEKPSPSIPLKLQINYAIATAEDLERNDSKKAIVNKQNILKRVIVLRQASQHSSEVHHQVVKASDGSFDRNASHEDQTPLDSSVKKEDSQCGYNTVEVVPFTPVSHIIRSPSIDYLKSQTENNADDHLENMFKHTYSVDKPVQELNPFAKLASAQSEVKMNLFGTLLGKKTEEYLPLEETEKSAQPNEQAPEKVDYTEKDVFNPLVFLIDSKKKEKSQPKQQTLVDISKKDSQGQNSLAESIHAQIFKGQLVESKIIGEEQELQRQYQQLKVRIQCYEEFISDIKRLPVSPPQKKYSKSLFIAMCVLSFFLGGAAKLIAF